MTNPLLEQIALLRATVGLMGEKDHAGWWPSAFFATGSTAFLSPVFARTELLAQCLGASAAASKVHDERIGVGDVYHLFRLPEDLEQGIHRLIQQTDAARRIRDWIASADMALQFLTSRGAAPQTNVVGPTRIAEVDGLRNSQTWDHVAAVYANGFKEVAECYPYFSDRK